MSVKSSSRGHVFYRSGAGSVGTIVRGSGARITDDRGREYIDAMGGVAVQIVGHGNATIGRAIAEATEGYAYAYAQSFTTPAQGNLAQRLTERLSLADGSAFYFGSGGSDANEIAMKFARQYHVTRGERQRYKVIGMTHGYHGNTMGTLSVSDRPSWRVDYEPYLFSSPKIGHWLTARELARFGGDEAALTGAALAELERVIWSEGAETISAFIFEPVSGSSVAGARHPDGFLEAAAELCRRHGILLIADEVFCGYGRTGLPRGMDLYAAEPDITTLGKGLGSGYVPLSACVLSPSIFDQLGGAVGRHQQGYTFSGLPLACAVGVAVSDYVEEHRLFERANEVGARMHEKFRTALADCPSVGDIRGRGMLVGIEFVTDRETLTPFPAERMLAAEIASFCQDRGVILAPGSPQVDDFRGGDQIHLAPPYVITDDEVDTVVGVVAEAVREVADRALREGSRRT